MKNVRLCIGGLLLMLHAAGTVSAQTDIDNWPDIPLLSITTDEGAEPTATVVDPPEGCNGKSIISEYVPGRLAVSLKGSELYDSGDYKKGESGIRIKIRGNSTGAYSLQKPYKLKLSKKADLLSFDDNYKSKDWALLSMRVWNPSMKNGECNILLVTGLAVCRALDFTWEPRTRFVNVVLNGKYRGLYNLTETVERADNRVKTGKTGFLIENDAYWWKEGEVWFKTTRQNTSMGYTFKYPDTDDITDEQKTNIASYMNTVENVIYSHKGVGDYVDCESFARWVLAHDILGSLDVAGSNMFLYKDSFDPNDPFASKLKMSTLWDFDTCFRMEDSQWSNQHTSYVFYYPELFQNGEFVTAYKNVYAKYKDVVYPYVEKTLNDIRTADGDAFEQSRQLHRTIYDDQCPNTLDEQIDDVLGHLKSRLDALGPMVEGLYNPEASVGGISKESVRMVSRTGLNGCDFTNVDKRNLPAGVYVERYSDGTVIKMIKRI